MVSVNIFLISYLFHTGYIENICNKQTDDLLIIHAQEYPTIPAAPYPCKYLKQALVKTLIF